MAANQEDSSKAHTNMVAHAVAEAAIPGANTESQYECPFCVMMRKGGCEEVFKAFMECGEKADKGDQQMAECLPQFEQLHLCMEKNKAVFDGLLLEMKEEEERSKAAAGLTTEPGSSTEAAATGMTTHQQQQRQQQQQQDQPESSSSSSLGGSSNAAQAVQHTTPSSAAAGMATAS